MDRAGTGIGYFSFCGSPISHLQSLLSTCKSKQHQQSLLLDCFSFLHFHDRCHTAFSPWESLGDPFFSRTSLAHTSEILNTVTASIMQSSYP